MGRRRYPLGLLVLPLVIASSCSGTNDAPPNAATNGPATSVTTTEDSAPISPPTTSESATPVAPTTTSAPATTGAPTSSVPQSISPATPYDPDAERPEPVDDPTSAYISRRSMSAAAVELVWSAPEGAASYELHRLPRTSDNPPDQSAMTAENQIHVGEESGVFLDEGVTADTRYWYGVRGLDQDRAVLSTGWHPADAVDDSEPPSPVDMQISTDDGAVTLTWTPPAENYELQSYAILRAVNGEELEVVSRTWNLEQRSFLDDDPPSGAVTYAVTAMDFHWNVSEPTEVTIDIS